MKNLKPKELPVNAALFDNLNPKRWIAGAASGLEYQVINKEADWNKYLPTNELQNRGMETWICTNAWGTSAFEIQQIYQIKHGLMSVRAMRFLVENGYMDKDGNPNYSEKAAAIMTGTKIGVGNYVDKTPWLAQNVGLIPERMLPFGNPKTEDDFFNPKQITKEMLDLAKKWAEIFLVQYETIEIAGRLKTDIRIDIRKHLRQAPLSIVIAICPGYRTDEIVRACTKDTSHVVGLTADLGDKQSIYDSYDPFVKNLATDYNIPYILKSVISERGIYTKGQIADAKRFALEISRTHANEVYISLVEETGRAYFIGVDGSLEYLHQPPGNLMSHMLSKTGKIVPVGVKDWERLKPAVIK